MVYYLSNYSKEARLVSSQVTSTPHDTNNSKIYIALGATNYNDQV